MISSWNAPSLQQGSRRVAAAPGTAGLAAQQTVDPLQLALRQHEAVDLLLPARTRHHDPTHQHRVGPLLLLRLRRRRVPA